MATVYAPIAKDSSIKTTESPSRNIADVLAQELSGISNAITGGSDKVPKTDIATVESTNTASRAYSVGELVYVNGNLYKVITAIAGGATFTVGTNIQSTTVSDMQINTGTDYSITGLAYRRRGGFVWIEGTGASLSIPTRTWTAIGTLPEMYRPEHSIFNIPITGGQYREYTGILRIQDTGLIEIFVNTASDYFIPCISYIAKP